ncbi:MAG: winged helix-turn-helix domain-containing protein [Nevskia sp.]|uniref:winged helix-turn-helix domain-containing protein n=1 Tax=Nevskia sp. TaxID=1929292 RepID=UPI0040371E34
MTINPVVTNAGETPLIWRFANAVSNGRTLELRVRGALVQLERKPVELLRNANEVVPRDELLKAVWPGRIATEASLSWSRRRRRCQLCRAPRLPHRCGGGQRKRAAG